MVCSLFFHFGYLVNKTASTFSVRWNFSHTHTLPLALWILKTFRFSLCCFCIFSSFCVCVSHFIEEALKETHSWVVRASKCVIWILSYEFHVIPLVFFSLSWFTVTYRPTSPWRRQRAPSNLPFSPFFWFSDTFFSLFIVLFDNAKVFCLFNVFSFVFILFLWIYS